MIGTLKLWIKQFWNHHGTKVLGSVMTVLAPLQTAILAGYIEVSKGIKNAVGAAIVFLGPLVVKRAIGSPPKSPPP